MGIQSGGISVLEKTVSAQAHKALSVWSRAKSHGEQISVLEVALFLTDILDIYVYKDLFKPHFFVFFIKVIRHQPYFTPLITQIFGYCAKPLILLYNISDTKYTNHDYLAAIKEKKRFKRSLIIFSFTAQYKSRKPLKTKAFGVVCGAPEGTRIPDLPLRSMAYHVIHGSDVTSNIIPYAE